MFTRRTMRAVIGAVSVAAVLGAAPVASAHGDGTGAHEVIARGTCSEGSTWALRLVELRRHHRRLIGVAFRVDSEGAGEIWRLQLRHGDRVVFADLRRSNEEGIVGVRRPVRNTRGVDLIGAKAVNVETRERCLARAAI